jgi:hypothetical protein
MFAKHTSLALVGLNLFYREMIQTGSGIFVEALEDALGQTMAYLWAVEEERVPDITDIPESVLANMTEWNVRLLQRR